MLFPAEYFQSGGMEEISLWVKRAGQFAGRLIVERVAMQAEMTGMRSAVEPLMWTPRFLPESFVECDILDFQTLRSDEPFTIKEILGSNS